MKAKTIHGQAYEFYDWATLGDDIFKLARQILQAGLEFDRVIALAKGGLTFSRSMVDYLGVPELSSLEVEFYKGIGETAKRPVITQGLSVSVRDEKILVFDDIADSGETLEAVLGYLRYLGVKDVKTAVLLQKPRSKVKPDFAALETEAWVIFPNEVRETITTLVEMWTAKGDSPEVIRQQLLAIGFSEAEVALFQPVE